MVEKFETKPKDEKSELLETTQGKLSDLKLSIGPDKSKDKEKFEKLSKDKTLKNWLNKLYNKSCEKTFSEEWEHFKKLHIWWTLQKIVKKYPNLLFYITWNLWLPLGEKNFSKLSLEQKLNFTALYQAVEWKGLFDKKNATPRDMLERVKEKAVLNMDKINKNFARTNITNFLQLEKTLTEDFKLTSAEAWKVKEYLELIKKHPEFIWKNEILEAWTWGWMIIWLLIGAALAILWMYYIDNIWNINPESNTFVEWVTSISEPRAVLKLITSEVDFSISWRKELKPRAEWSFYRILNSNVITRTILLNPYMNAQTKEILMDLDWTASLQYDLEKWSRIDLDVKKDWKKWEVYVQLPYPDIVTVRTDAHVTKVDRELVHVREYDNGQEELRQELKNKAIEDLRNNPGFYENQKNETAKQLFGLFSAMYAPLWLEITDVHVKYINPDEWPKNYLDPEGKHIIKFE